MKILTNKRDSFTKDSVCGIGSFDGVHRGHQEIIKYMKRLAHAKKRIGIITFTPLPFFVLKSAPIITLTLRKEKEDIIRELGTDFIYYFNFSREFSKLKPADFVDLLVEYISPSIVVIGENFHFGEAREGSASVLKHLAQNKFLVHIVPRVKENGTISSTRIRELLLLGHVKAANKLLGREYTVSGRVIKGKGKGTKLGFPTINIKVDKEKLLPLDGIYKVKVMIRNKEYVGALFCRHDVIEVHVLDFSNNLYRKEVSVRLLERIRNIRRFTDDDALRAAIARDVATIRQQRT